MSRDESWSVARYLWLGGLAMVVLIGGVVGWGMHTSIAGAVVVTGQIEVEQNRQVVQHPDGGVVAAILIAEGDLVDAGQPLLRLDGALLLSELAIVEGQYFEALARQARLGAERDGTDILRFPDPLLLAMAERAEAREQAEGQRRLFAARAETLARQVEQLERRQEQARAQLDGLSAQNEALRTEAALLAAELDTQERLQAQGLTQSARVTALQREAARLDGQLGNIAAEIAQVHGRITEIALQIVTLESSRREEAEAELRETGARVLELAERRRSLAERIERLELRAPVSGQVYGLQITTPRAVLRAAEPVLHIVPRDRPLLLSVRIAPADIDQVFVGQEASVMFPALSMRDLPELRGVVTLVSADAFLDDRMGSSFYRAELVLSDEARGHLGERPLLPGMPVEAFIRTEARTPLDYLTRPLTDYFMRAFRES
ncbi:MAG: HlyD family type I secretion periplasmic adaptor subunit [Pararhodobacter sp.]